MGAKRRYERAPWFCPVQLKVLPDGPVVSASAFDISLGGVGVIANVMLERGVAVRVQFHIRNGEAEPIKENVLGRIAFFRADEDCNRIGIEFLDTIYETTHPTLTKILDNMSSVAC